MVTKSTKKSSSDIPEYVKESDSERVARTALAKTTTTKVIESDKVYDRNKEKFIDLND